MTPRASSKKLKKTKKATTTSKRSHGLGTLKSGRPPTATSTRPSQSAQETRRQIRAFHTLNKQLAVAEAKGDHAAIAQLKLLLESSGGLGAYQAASIQGQALDRGGDSSSVLMNWLAPHQAFLKDLVKAGNGLKFLEVGALSTQNACSKSGCFDTTRIDLHSQSPGILQQDFLHRPLPTSVEEVFDVISLSLVLNFVPSAEGRGQMLRRTTQFLRRHPAAVPEVFPALFLVLPAPCINNSRYMSEERLTCMMGSLGFVLLERKETAKLVYYLWHLRDMGTEEGWGKKEIRAGRGRNNFCVVLR